MSPVVQAYVAGILTSFFAVGALLAVIELISLRAPATYELPSARSMRRRKRELRASVIARAA